MIDRMMFIALTNESKYAVAAQLAENLEALTGTAAMLLAKIDNMTSVDFSLGGEHDEREALRACLAMIVGPMPELTPR